MTRSTLTHLQCSACRANYAPGQLLNLCPACGKPLLARYDLRKAAETLTRASLATRRPDMWRYEEVLPVQDDRAVNQALARFSRMRSQHERRLYDVYNTLSQLPRPDVRMTRVPNGDLWVMTQFALNDLIIFGDYVSKLGVLN